MTAPNVMVSSSDIDVLAGNQTNSTLYGNLTVTGSLSSASVLQGNLTFSNGALTTGDYNTLANRPVIQSNTGVQTFLEIAPPTGGVIAGLNIENTPPSGFANAQCLELTINSTRAILTSFGRGTNVSTPLPLYFSVGGTNAALQITNPGNIIVGYVGGQISFFGGTPAAQGSAAAMVDLPTLVAYLKTIGLLGS